MENRSGLGPATAQVVQYQKFCSFSNLLKQLPLLAVRASDGVLVQEPGTEGSMPCAG